MTGITKPATSSKSSKYSFRTKFAKRLSEANMAPNSLDNAFTIALSMTIGKMFMLLWHMSFTATMDGALQELGLTTDVELAPNVTIVKEGYTYIPIDIVPSFRKELRLKYQKEHPDFLKINGSSYAFEQLVKDLGSKVLAYGILTRVKRNLSWDPEEMERTIYLLRSDKENFVHGGLRNIGLTNYEAQELHDKAYVIASFLENLNELRKVENASQSLLGYNNRGESLNQPFSGLKEQLEAHSIEIPVVTAEETESIPIPFMEEDEESSASAQQVLNDEVHAVVESVSTHNEPISQVEPKSLDSMAILQNSELFKQFIDVAAQLTSLGFVPTEVLQKDDEIKRLLEADAALR